MTTSQDARDLWIVTARDCGREPGPLEPDRARVIRSVHAGHGPDCRPYLAAAKVCAESDTRPPDPPPAA
ncbi:hypothetical protein [Nocardia wallacei]|uniref:hypothetical protein n=1 Tax=Nocardia wallacei TaxID=480035 RepID=UPI0024572BEF|nr:hypothetical protein [Nocardia wallacei]